MTPMELLENYSLEITAKGIDKLYEADGIVPKGTEILIPFLPGEDLDLRLKAVKVVKELGFVPMPNLAARRFRSRNELESCLGGICTDRVLVVAGDPPQPEGPFEDALSIIKTGVLQKYGIKYVGISGYPSGHPKISFGRLSQSMAAKTATLTEMGLECSIVTQFDFDAEGILTWVKKIREDGISVPVRVGIPGPINLERLAVIANRCGVPVPKSYDPNEVIEGLARNYEPDVHGKIQLHFFPFGGVIETGSWIKDYRKKAIQCH